MDILSDVESARPIDRKYLDHVSDFVDVRSSTQNGHLAFYGDVEFFMLPFARIDENGRESFIGYILIFRKGSRDDFREVADRMKSVATELGLGEDYISVAREDIEQAAKRIIGHG